MLQHLYRTLCAQIVFYSRLNSSVRYISLFRFNPSPRSSGISGWGVISMLMKPSYLLIDGWPDAIPSNLAEGLVVVVEWLKQSQLHLNPNNMVVLWEQHGFGMPTPDPDSTYLLLAPSIKSLGMILPISLLVLSGRYFYSFTKLNNWAPKYPCTYLG